MPFLKTVPYRFGRLLDFPLIRFTASLPGILIMLFWLAALGFSSRQRIVGLSNVYWGKAAALLPARMRFYDANDDHLAFPGSPQWLPGYLASWLSRVDLVFSVSPELTATLPLAPGTRTIELGNGVEFSHFATPRPDAPEGLSGIGKPVLGYAGAMDWLDTELVTAVARAWPQYSIVLLGPAYRRGWWRSQSALNCLGNVHYFGKVEYNELPAWVQRFDLALIPMLANRLKGVSHPNKLYEYCAAGVPVLSTNYCSAVERAGDVVHVAVSRDEFVRMVPEALADRRSGQRLAFAKRHSWDELARMMVQELTEAYGRAE
ncbi:MAG: glycosyltransferase family 1 protein [Chlorobiaceae bacterium]|nr:glycosyltransferase family 1 protein [Chlorobiaceae bacterium]